MQCADHLGLDKLELEPECRYRLTLSISHTDGNLSHHHQTSHILHNILARGSDFRQGVLMAMPTKTGPGLGSRLKLYYSLAAISRLLISLYLFASSSNAAV